MLKSRGIVSSVRIVDRELDATIFDSLLGLLLLDIMTKLLQGITKDVVLLFLNSITIFIISQYISKNGQDWPKSHSIALKL